MLRIKDKSFACYRDFKGHLSTIFSQVRKQVFLCSTDFKYFQNQQKAKKTIFPWASIYELMIKKPSHHQSSILEVPTITKYPQRSNLLPTELQMAAGDISHLISV